MLFSYPGRAWIVLVFALAIFLCSGNRSWAELNIFLTDAGNDDVLIEFSGSGTAGRWVNNFNFNDNDLAFLDFDALPFGSNDFGNDSRLTIDLASDLEIAVTPVSGNPAFTLVYEELSFFNHFQANVNNTDIGLQNSDPNTNTFPNNLLLRPDDTYTFSGGTTLVSNASLSNGDEFKFSNLTPGTYTSTNSNFGDTLRFGTVNFIVVSVPEPATLLLFGTTLTFLGRRRR